MIKKTVVGFLFAIFLFFGAHADALTFSPAIREYTKNPGESVTETLRLFNDNDTDKMYYPVFVDFTAPSDESGSPNFVPEGTFAKSSSLAEWFQDIEPVIIKANGRVELKMTINIPADAEPGGHYGAIFFSDMPVNPDSIGVGAQTGPIFLVNVLGDIKEEAQLLEFKSIAKFQSSLPVDFYYRVENKGSVHESPNGKMILSGWWPTRAEFLVNERKLSHVLPHSIRKFTTSWVGGTSTPVTFFEKAIYEWQNLAIGRFTATLDLDYGVSKAYKLNGTTTFWVLPWHFLLLVLGVLIVLFGILKMYNRSIIKSAQKRK